jgi:hypothetical protein
VSGWILLLAGLVIGVGDFAIGYGWSRKGGEGLDRLPDGSAQSPEAMRRLGRMVMLLAPIFFLVFAALAFGWIPAGGIVPIGAAQ